MIYGLNLWHGTPENAAAEAAYVFKTLGPRLICFQIGNEPDMDHDAGSKERWTFDHYWETLADLPGAVKQAVPDARFAGPDIAKEYELGHGDGRESIRTSNSSPATTTLKARRPIPR